MIFEKCKMILMQLLFLPVLILSTIAQDTTDTTFASDGSGYGTGMWWFWVATLLAIVGLAIWWASRPGSTPTNTGTKTGP